MSPSDSFGMFADDADSFRQHLVAKAVLNVIAAARILDSSSSRSA